MSCIVDQGSSRDYELSVSGLVWVPLVKEGSAALRCVEVPAALSRLL